MKKKVVVGMSGGVDSSVAALLLKREGYDVTGLFMKNWECASAKDEYEDVAKVCDHIGIPHYAVNFVEEYRANVFNEFLKDLEAGLTPNPDILCNREIKFKVFLDKALSLGADFLATGHYCRLDAESRLLRGLDPNKDQSYFLHAVPQDAFKQVLFPIGHLPKPEVRRIALEAGLPTAAKKDSTGICFIGKRDFRPFVQEYLKPKPGPFQTLDGKTVGTHEGAQFYTIGQRKGMGLGGEGEAWYVIRKDIAKNIVFVDRGDSHLFATTLRIHNPTWIATPPQLPLTCTAKIRYRSPDAPCILHPDLTVTFDKPERAITPGQSIVFYQGDLCLGGAIIRE